MSDPTRAAKCMLKRLCKYYSEAPVLSWSCPNQEMPSEVRSVTYANWAGNWRDCARRRVDGFISVIVCCRRIRRHSRLWRCQLQSEKISITKGAALALEVRSAVVDHGMTFNMVCETDPSVGRAMATRRGVGRLRHLDARLFWLQQLCAEGVVEVRARLVGRFGNKDCRSEANDLAFERNTLRPPIGWSTWMEATTLTAVADCRVLI